MTKENTEYIRLLAAFSGQEEDDIIDAIVAERRKRDDATLKKVVHLLSNMWPVPGSVCVDNETPEQPKPRKKPGPKPKAEKAEKMTKEEFMDYFSNRDINRAQGLAEQLKAEEEW